MKKIKLQDRAQGQGHIGIPKVLSLTDDDLDERKEPSNGNGREMNPMKIDLILESMFSFCSVETLKNCRLVSKQWKDLSLKNWRDNAVFRPGKKAEGLRTFRLYLEQLQSEDDPYQLKRYPFKNFEIAFGPMEYLKRAATPVSSITRRVILCDYTGGVQLKTFLSKFHSLEVLELDNCDWNWGGRIPLQSSVKRLRILRSNNSPDGLVGNWEAFLGCFPNLEALTIEYRTPESAALEIRRGILHAAKSIRNAEGGHRLMPLKELKFVHVPKAVGTSDDTNYMRMVHTITECRFPLESLTFHLFLDFDMVHNHIFNVLKSCKDTLQYLETSFMVHIPEGVSIMTMHEEEDKSLLICMSALRQVRLTNGAWGFKILADLDLPNLEKVVVANEESTVYLDKVHSAIGRWSFSEEAVYAKLETLDFIDDRCIPKPIMIKFFGKIMPNLVNLTIPLDKHTFQIVCERFRGLKTLNVLPAQCRFVELDDESMTGISKEAGPVGPRKPNITQLAQLTHLSIAYGKDLEVNAAFTDHSVIYGLLELPHLKSLSMSFKELSDENKTKLLSHVRGIVNIKVKEIFMPESYCNFNIVMIENREC